MISLNPAVQQMLPDISDEIDEAAYRKHREYIDTTFPKDWFIGIIGGKIVADAKTFEDLSSKLKLLGHDPRDTLIVQSGEPDLNHVLILGVTSA